MDIRDRVDRAGDLKGELVDFATSPGFDRRLRAEMANAAEFSESSMEAGIRAIETMLFDRDERGGRTLVERYLLANKRLAEDDRALLEGWRGGGVYGMFQILEHKGERMTLLNLIDELEYVVYATGGAESINAATRGGFMASRVLPVGDCWVLSGSQHTFGKRDRNSVAQMVAQFVAEDPFAAFRNPTTLQRALELSQQHHEVFLSLFGQDSFSGNGHDVEAAFDRYLRGCGTTTDFVNDSDFFPDELREADDVALLHHPVKGASFYRDHGRVEGAHRTPPKGRKDPGVELVRAYLDDETIPPFVLERLASKYPDSVDPLYHLVLNQPHFTWAADGDALLRERKAKWYETAEIPDLALIPTIVQELM